MYVLPKIAIETNDEFNDETLVISISSPECENPVIRGKHVYKFKFHDITEEFMVGDRLWRPMEYEIAQQIAEIAINNRDKSEWIIHCEAGISRSPGVALGLSRYIELNPGTAMLQKMFPCHNSYVRKYIEKALREKLVELGEQ